MQFSEDFNEYEECELMTHTHMRKFEDDLVVYSCGNLAEKHLHYMIIWKRSTNQFCRLNLLKPSYIGYKDENLKLSRDELQKLMEILQYVNGVGCERNLSIWDSVLIHTNESYDCVDRLYMRSYYYVPLPDGMPMPDYMKISTY